MLTRRFTVWKAVEGDKGRQQEGQTIKKYLLFGRQWKEIEGDSKKDRLLRNTYCLEGSGRR